jgi:hypothetical protein
MVMGGQRHPPAALTLGKRPGTHCIEGWVDPRAGLDGCGIRSPDLPASSDSLYRLNYPGPQEHTLQVHNTFQLKSIMRVTPNGVKEELHRVLLGLMCRDYCTSKFVYIGQTAPPSGSCTSVAVLPKRQQHRATIYGCHNGAAEDSRLLECPKQQFLKTKTLRSFEKS